MSIGNVAPGVVTQLRSDGDPVWQPYELMVTTTVPSCPALVSLIWLPNSEVWVA
jgi:hypothetical protein